MPEEDKRRAPLKRQCQRVRLKRAKRRAEEADKESALKLRRTLLDSKLQLVPENTNHLGVCLSTFYRHLRQEYPEVGRATRRLDQCNRCHGWDNSIVPQMRRCLKEWRVQLESLMPGYWEAWDSGTSQQFSQHEKDELSAGFMRAFGKYVDTGARRRGHMSNRTVV